MDTYTADAAVIGAGVVGLAIARRLALAGLETFILERGPRFGEGTSARNSEVVHAGIYYPKGSLKARACVAGRHALYAYCDTHAVGYRKLGKLIVATSPAEADGLEAILSRAEANGVEGMALVSGAEARAMEPELSAIAALHSPETGIVDSHGLMLALLGEAQAHGAMFVPTAQVEAGHLHDDGTMTLRIGGPEPMRLACRHVINAGGLHANAIARRIEGVDDVPDLALVKGNYFSLAGRAPFSRLIYPAPRDGGLGIHLTLDLAGRARFGPDTEWLATDDPDAIDYAVDPARGAAFVDAIRTYWPGLPDGALLPDYAGVRPKCAGEAYPDFEIRPVGPPGRAAHAMLYGIESPGLTACLAIADEVAGLLGIGT